MTSSLKDSILGLIRHLLTTCGGVAVANGYLTEQHLIDVTGALMILIGTGWSIYEKLKRNGGGQPPASTVSTAVNAIEKVSTVQRKLKL